MQLGGLFEEGLNTFQAEPGLIWELREEFCGGLLLLQEVLFCR